jgi:outer membrane protein TolC
LLAPAAAHAQAASASAETLTLDQAVSRAVENSRRVRTASLEVTKVEAEASALRRQRLPGFSTTLYENALLVPLDFSFQTGAFGVFPNTGPIPGQPTDIRIGRQFNTVLYGRATQPLSQLYKIGLGVHALELGRDAAREKLTLQQQEIANNVKRTYYAIWQAQGGLATLADALNLYRELERVVAGYLERQVVLKSDLLDVQSKLAGGQQQYLSVQGTLATLKEQLNALMGRDIDTPFEVAPLPTVALEGNVDLATAEARARAKRPELREAGLRVKQAEYDHRLKRAEYIPDVSLAFNYIGFRHVSTLPPNIAAFGLLVSWEPFDWGRRSKEAAAKRAVVEQAKAGEKETEAMVVIDVRHRFRALEEARARVQETELARASLGERLRVAKDRSQQEAGMARDLLEAQARFAEADQRHREAVLAFWMAKADLEKAFGE